jgi:hypothetical protein
LDHYRRESAQIFQLFQDMVPAGGEIGECWAFFGLLFHCLTGTTEKASIDEGLDDHFQDTLRDLPVCV